MNSFFITLLLKTDPELKNEDIMGREVKRLLYLNTHSLGFKTTKQHSKVFFLLMFLSQFNFFRSASKTTRPKTQADFDTCFCDGLFYYLQAQTIDFRFLTRDIDISFQLNGE